MPAEYQGACNVPIPIEVIALIGEKLVTKALWSKTYNAAQTEQARRTGRQVAGRGRCRLAEAPEALVRPPIAKRIAPDNWNYVRQRISKPAK